jgi:hypothetical protein
MMKISPPLMLKNRKGTTAIEGAKLKAFPDVGKGFENGGMQRNVKRWLLGQFLRPLRGWYLCGP